MYFIMIGSEILALPAYKLSIFVKVLQTCPKNERRQNSVTFLEKLHTYVIVMLSRWLKACFL